MTVTLNVTVVALVALAETGSKPESMPPATGEHGVEKFDCVTVWLFGEKVNVIVSLGWAVKLVGLKASCPPAPTVTW